MFLLLSQAVIEFTVKLEVYFLWSSQHTPLSQNLLLTYIINNTVVKWKVFY
jgi:hypothetical protein